MCVAFCHRQRALYWNHEDCSFEFCPFIVEEPRGCYSCQYRQPEGNICGLTRAPLPAVKGCCHWNVELVTGRQWVTPEMLIPLGIVGPEPAVDILAGLEAPYEVDAAGRVWVDPGHLGLPETYGVGTNELGP